MAAIIFSCSHSLIVPRCYKRAVQLNFTLLYQIFRAQAEFYNVQLLIEFLSSANLRSSLHYCTCMGAYVYFGACICVRVYSKSVCVSVEHLHEGKQLVLTNQICG